MSRNFCYIDTVDSSKHYSVVGTPEEVASELASPVHHIGRFVKFQIADRDKRTLLIDPDKVIAVLEPVK